MATFEFNKEMMALNEIEIDQIGEFAIEAVNEESYCYYMIVSTNLGTTTIATCGPIIPDVTLLPSGYSTSFYKMPYKEQKLEKQISTFLNDPYKKIVQAKILSFDDAVESFRDLGEYLTEHKGDY